MLAIVLTCDKYRALTEHMIYQYDRLWPNHRFRFRIPYQALRGDESRQIQFIQSSPHIRETVLTLLSDLDDEEWIYWTIDDKYPMALNLARIEGLQDWILSQKTMNGLLFCRCREVLNPAFLTGAEILDYENHRYLERSGYEQIWIHQFLRVKILRQLFQCFPEIIARAADMDHFKNESTMPRPQGLFVVQDNLAIFGESTSGQVLTQNCYESILRYGLRLPSWFTGTTGRFIAMGKLEGVRIGG